VENSFKTAAGKHMWHHHRQKYKHTQGSPAMTNAISNLIPQFMNSSLKSVCPVEFKYDFLRRSNPKSYKSILYVLSCLQFLLGILCIKRIKNGTKNLSNL